MISVAKLIDTKRLDTPLEQNIKLTLCEYDDLFKINSGDSIIDNEDRYIRIVSRVLYLITMTRLYIAYISDVHLKSICSHPNNFSYECSNMDNLVHKGQHRVEFILSDYQWFLNHGSILRWWLGFLSNTRKSVKLYSIRLVSMMISWKSKKHAMIFP